MSEWEQVTSEVSTFHMMIVWDHALPMISDTAHEPIGDETQPLDIVRQHRQQYVDYLYAQIWSLRGWAPMEDDDVHYR